MERIPIDLIEPFARELAMGLYKRQIPIGFYQDFLTADRRYFDGKVIARVCGREFVVHCKIVDGIGEARIRCDDTFEFHMEDLEHIYRYGSVRVSPEFKNWLRDHFHDPLL